MSSPQTPQHSRNSSTVDAYAKSPSARRQSRTSFNNATSPGRNVFSREDTLDLNAPNGGADGGNEMGNLADELADAFSDSAEEDVEYSEGEEHITRDRTSDDGIVRTGRTRDGSLSIPSPHRKGHRKKESAYDGSEYGSESDMDASGFPPTLVARIDAVESLARRGNENYGGPTDDVVKRVTELLRDLGSQSSVEGSASR